MHGKVAADPIFRSAFDFAKRQLNVNPNDHYVAGDPMVAYGSVGDSKNLQGLMKALLELTATDPQPHGEIALLHHALGT